MAPGMITEALKHVDADVKYLWAQGKVVPEAQAKLASLGFGEMDIFAKLGDTVQDVRKTIETDFGISPESGLPGKNVISRIISAWERAYGRGVKRRAEDAQQRATDQPRRLPKSTHLQLIRTYNENHEKLDDEGTPAQSYVEWIVQTVEDGEQEAERLKNFVSCPKDVEGLLRSSPGTCVN